MALVFPFQAPQGSESTEPMRTQAGELESTPDPYIIERLSYQVKLSGLCDL